MSYLNTFDEAVNRKCGRLSVANIAKTGYYRQSDMDKSYKDLYLNSGIQSRFGGGVSKMKTNPEDVFMKSSVGGGMVAVGDALPPVFNARIYNLGTSIGSMSMFSQSEYGEVDMSSDSLEDETRSERMRRMGGSMRDFESQISSGDSYWDVSAYGDPTRSELDYFDRQNERLEDDQEQSEYDRWLQDTTHVRAEEAMIEDVPRLRNMRRQAEYRGYADIGQGVRTAMWVYDDQPTGRREILTGLPPMHETMTRPVALYQPPPPIRTINESVPNQAVPSEDAINQQPRATF
jgi:hypothetical protein